METAKPIMFMAKPLICFIAGIFLLGCGYNKNCVSNMELIGFYQSVSEPEIHTIEIVADGNFIHIYKAVDTILINKGVWNFDPKKCSIIFSGWKSYGKYKEKDCSNGCSYNVNIKRNILIFNFDLEEMNFIK